MNISLVLNPDAGSLLDRDVHDIADRVCTAFQKAGHSCRPHIGPGDRLIETLEDAVSNTDALMVGGGDGTVVAAANAAMKRGIALGILPLGTVNLLAKDLNIPLELEDAVEALAQGRIIEIDVGVVNGQLFLVAVVLGVFVDLVKKREETRNDTGPLKWPSLLVEMGKEVINSEPMFLTLQTGRRRQRLRTCAAVISNNDFEDTVSLVPKRSSLDKGELALLIAESHSGWGFINLMARLFSGKTKDDPKLIRMALRELQISSPSGKIAASVDGEVQEMASPLSFSIKPGALKVLVPRGAV